MAADAASRVEEADEAGAALLVPIADILSSQCPRRPASRPSQAARRSGLPYAYRRTGSDAVSFTKRRSTDRQLVPSFDASAVRSRPTVTGSDEARHFRLIFLRHPRFPGHQGVTDASAPSRACREGGCTTDEPPIRSDRRKRSTGAERAKTIAFRSPPRKKKNPPCKQGVNNTTRRYRCIRAMTNNLGRHLIVILAERTNIGQP